jgi:hypothetical protein
MLQAEYNMLEIATNGTRNRGRVYQADLRTVDYYGKPGRVDCYSSAYQLPQAVESYIREKGSISGWKDAKAAWLHFDIDGWNLEVSQRDARKLVEKICTPAYGVFIDDLRIWFSGAKGFHVALISSEIDALPGGPHTADRIKKYALVLAGGLCDPSPYDPVRLWRIPNSINSKTGLYKIPLFASELFSLTIEKIKTLAKNQRSIPDACRQTVERLKNAA